MEKSALAVGSEPGFTACPVQGQRQNSKDRPAAHRLYQRAQELGPKGVDAAQQQAGGQAGPDMNMGGGASQGGNEAGYNDDVVDADYKEV